MFSLIAVITISPHSALEILQRLLYNQGWKCNLPLFTNVTNITYVTNHCHQISFQLRRRSGWDSQLLWHWEITNFTNVTNVTNITNVTNHCHQISVQLGETINCCDWRCIKLPPQQTGLHFNSQYCNDILYWGIWRIQLTSEFDKLDWKAVGKVN